MHLKTEEIRDCLQTQRTTKIFLAKNFFRSKFLNNHHLKNQVLIMTDHKVCIQVGFQLKI